MKNKFNLIYIVNAKMPTQKAHGIHVAKMCENFAKEGVTVTMVVPTRLSIIKDDPYNYYSVERNFKISKIFSLDLIPFFPWLGYWIQYITFSISSIFYLLTADRRNTIIYTREYIPAFIFKLFGFFTIYEAHRIIPRSKFFFYLVRRSDAIVTNSKGVANEFNLEGFKAVMDYPNGVDLKNFDFKIDRNELRRKLGLPLDKKIITYTGHLYGWKGIKNIFDTMRIFKDKDFCFLFVGGTVNDVGKYKEKAEREQLQAIFTGHKSHHEVPLYLKASDLLLLPNSKITEESVKYTSPIKLFEYMASGVPIIASNLPSIREILSDKNAILFESDDSASLSKAIIASVEDIEGSNNRARNAHEEVKKYTWNRRAKEILSFILPIYESRF